MPASFAPSMKSIGVSSKAFKPKFTPTEEYERRAVKAVMEEADRVGEVVGAVLLVAEKQMGYVEPAVPYPDHTIGQTIDYTLNYTTNALSNLVSQTNTDACQVIDDIREEIAHYSENVEQRKEQEEKDHIKKDKADRAKASKEAFKRKITDAFKKEEHKVKELTDKLVEKVQANEVKRKEFDHQVAESMEKFGKKVVHTVETLEEKVKENEVKRKEFDHQVAESMDKLGKKIVETFEKVDQNNTTEKKETPETSAPKKKVDFSHHDEKLEIKTVSPADDLAHEKKSKSSRHARKSKSKATPSTDDLAPKENVKPAEDEPTPEHSPEEVVVDEASTSTPFEDTKGSKSTLGGKLAQFFGLDKKTSKKPVEVEEPVSSEPSTEPSTESQPEPVLSAEDDNDACCEEASVKASKGKEIEVECDDCPPDSGVCCETPAEAVECDDCPSDSGECCETPAEVDDISEILEASKCGKCVEGLAPTTVDCCKSSLSAADRDEEPCAACPDETEAPKTVEATDAKVSKSSKEPSDADVNKSSKKSTDAKTKKPSKESSCFACTPESENKCSAETTEPEAINETSEAPTTEATTTEVFHHLKGRKGGNVATMIFNDSRVQSLNPPKQFTMHANGDESCLVHEGNSETNPALGFIKLSWSRVSKGPVFILGEPYFETTAVHHKKSSKSPRGRFSSYSPEKSKKPEPFFTFTFPAHPYAKKSHSKDYTWRAAPNMNPESDAEEIELREGGKKKMDGELVAVWKMDPESGDHILLYKQPFEEVDESMMDKWIAALLLTSYCATKHGLGDKKPVSA